MSAPRQARASGAGREAPQWAHLGPAVSPQHGSEAAAVAAAPRRRGGDVRARGSDAAAPAPDGPTRNSGRSADRRGADRTSTDGSSTDGTTTDGSSAVGPDRSRRSSGPHRVGLLGVLTRLLVALAVPVSLLVVSIRLVATPLFLWIEYHRPGFPEDPYGFGPEDRMTLGSHGMDYILNWAPGPFLDEVRTSSGRPWFTPEEVSHMTDVKWVLQIGLWAGVVVVVLALVLALLRRRDRDGLLASVAVGGWLTVIATALLAVLAVVGWEQFFAAFHSIFFSEGTWTFSTADTLIRLYPTQFWIDAAAVIAVITVGGSVLAAVLAQRARSARGRRRA